MKRILKKTFSRGCPRQPRLKGIPAGTSRVGAKNPFSRSWCHQPRLKIGGINTLPHHQGRFTLRPDESCGASSLSPATVVLSFSGELVRAVLRLQVRRRRSLCFSLLGRIFLAHAGAVLRLQARRRCRSAPLDPRPLTRTREGPPLRFG